MNIKEQYVKFYIGEVTRVGLDVQKLWGSSAEEFEKALVVVFEHMLEMYDRNAKRAFNPNTRDRVNGSTFNIVNGPLLWEWIRVITESTAFIGGSIGSDVRTQSGHIVFNQPKEAEQKHDPLKFRKEEDVRGYIDQIVKDGERVFTLEPEYARTFITAINKRLHGVESVVIERNEYDKLKFELFGRGIVREYEQPIKQIKRSDIELYSNIQANFDLRGMRQISSTTIPMEINRFCYWYYSNVLKNASHSELISNPTFHLLSHIMYYTQWQTPFVRTTTFHTHMMEEMWYSSSTEKDVTENISYFPHYMSEGDLDKTIRSLLVDEPITVVPKNEKWLYYDNLHAAAGILRNKGGT